MKFEEHLFSRTSAFGNGFMKNCEYVSVNSFMTHPEAIIIICVCFLWNEKQNQVLFLSLVFVYEFRDRR